MTSPESAWVPHPDVDIEAVNNGIDPSSATVDVAIYYPNNLDVRHHKKVNADLLLSGFQSAREVFGSADVQLKLVAFKTGKLDPSYFSISSAEPGTDVPMGRYSNMYVEAERSPKRITDQAREAFEAMIGEVPDSDLIVHIVTVQAMYMEHFEPLVKHRVYQKQTIETSGLSFPGYMHGDTIPRALRGVISITNLRRTEDSWKTIAHELGHKLMNVSHEHGEISPAHEVLSDEGLMFYGKGTEIGRGAEGRYHYERLHRSPFLYRETEDGARHYNPDYQNGGFYYDPIYEGVSVDF